ncbi:hypothetical protein PC116_g9879 [Phytophthora cactorum]|uniref:Uncharacterized protein n=1 Tax=Phytophthora cactorum TaxID=29920 RepID=A0A8T1E7G0_9STRA|nr:hypothetical protein PC114_g6669 [Phytophthora cactorum]KAG2947133.1 hypothetical protein PC117_g7054 [Phytophthora cactorum]KAG3027064.1 hypothetical protein PC120_g5590 [Phytophthora cactorum]KAG3031015.1 hypothetical protein PC119_g6085 [Phytophthora cactorum]KAG3178872.1 hypothetical protein C6341_g7779 [Phytophthora cactorum]
MTAPSRDAPARQLKSWVAGRGSGAGWVVQPAAEQEPGARWVFA